MARVWKRKSDKGKPGSAWTLTYTDWKLVEGEWRAWERSRMGYADKAATLKLGHRLEEIARKRRDGLVDDREDRRALEGRRPLQEHIDDYEKALKAKGSNAKHITQTIGYISAISDTLGWKSIGAVRADTLSRHLGDQRTKQNWSPRTLNARLVAFKGFTRWLVQHDRLDADPLASARRVRQTDEVRRKRRALSEFEVDRLLTAVESAPSRKFTRSGKRYTISGPDRAMLYRFLLGTGLRLNEAASLTPRSLHLDDKDGPVVVVEAAYSKRRREDVQPLPAPLVALLRPWLRDRPTGAKLWTLPHKPVERLLVPDLHRARVLWLREVAHGKARRDAREGDILRYRDAAGRFADFHAMRHTYITRLGLADVPLTVAQRLARHSTPTLTANTYTHVGLADGRAALERAFDRPENTDSTGAAAQATGTDGGPCTGQQSERCAQRHAQREPGVPALKLAGLGTTHSAGVSTNDAHEVRLQAPAASGLGKTRHGRASPGRAPYPNRGERIRTSDLLTPSQNLESPNCLKTRDLRGSDPGGAAPCAAQIGGTATAEVPTDPGLSTIIAAWDGLPAAVRTGMVAMVEAARDGER